MCHDVVVNWPVNNTFNTRIVTESQYVSVTDCNEREQKNKIIILTCANIVSIAVLQPYYVGVRLVCIMFYQ